MSDGHGKRVGVLRVVTSENRSFLEHHQRLIQAGHPELTFETRCLPDQPNGIHDAVTLTLALPQIEARWRWPAPAWQPPMSRPWSRRFGPRAATSRGSRLPSPTI